MDKVIYNKDLFQYIISFVPLTEIEKRNRRKVISELKHFHCEWSYHIPRCYVCAKHHPCVIHRSRGLCDNCKIILNLYIFGN